MNFHDAIDIWADALDDLDHGGRMAAAAGLVILVAFLALSAVIALTVLMFNVSLLVGWVWVAGVVFQGTKFLWKKISQTS